MTTETEPVPPAVDARYMTGTSIEVSADTLDWEFVNHLLNQAFLNEHHLDKAARYRRVRDAIRLALAEYDSRIGMGADVVEGMDSPFGAGESVEASRG